MNKQNKLITYFKETISLILSIRSRKKRVCYRSALLPNTFLRYHVENKTKCVPHINQVCAEHSKINTKTDSIKELATVLLTKSHQESFVKGDFIVFNNTKIIHRPDKILPDTLTINFVSDIGDNEIDVFVSHQTPERKVLLKADTTEPIKKEVLSEVINKSLMILTKD